MYRLQSILFDKNIFPTYSAVSWLQENGFKSFKMDETTNYLKYYQQNEKMLKKEGYDKHIIHEVFTGVKFILYYDVENKDLDDIHV